MMKAQVLKSIGKLELCDYPIPELNSGDVLVKVHACGICGSDIPRIFEKGTYHFPTIPGHEFSGEVVKCKDAKDANLIGKRVTVFPLIPCRECESCLKHKYEMCKNYDYIGSRSDGAFAEYVKVPAWNCLPIPESVSYEEAALVEPSAVALHAIKKIKIKKGNTVAVFGPGPVGLLIAQFAKLMKARVFIIGVDSNNYEFIDNLGFKEYCNSSKENVVEWIMEKTNNLGADFCFDVVGKQKSISNCVNTVALEGKIVLVGNPDKEFDLSKEIYSKILRKQLTMIGTWNSTYGEFEKSDWNAVIEALADKKIDVKSLITHRFTLENMHKGLEIKKNKSEFCVKIMVVNKK